MYAHALYGAGMRNLKRPVDALEKDLSSVASMVASHKKLNTLFQVSNNQTSSIPCLLTRYLRTPLSAARPRRTCVSAAALTPPFAPTMCLQVLTSALKSVTVNPITKNFLLLLADNGRINILDKIQSAYKTIMQAHRNEVLPPHYASTPPHPRSGVGARDHSQAVEKSSEGTARCTATPRGAASWA